MSVDMFGRYQSQSTRQLAQISSSKYPDTNKDMEANLRRLNQFVDYIAEYLQIMQKGVDQANEDAIGRIRDMASDLVVLLGGGELLYGIDLGDLQYFLPALGAIFGFDADKPFPLSLIDMAEHFFLGYVVPLDSFIPTIEDIILGWMTAFGLDDETVANIKELLDAIASVTTDSLALFNNLWDMLDIFGINTDGFGPFADLWHSVTQLLGSFSLETLGNLVDPVLHALAPWIQELAQAIDQLDQIIKAFSGGLTNLQGILNFANLFTPFTDLMSGAFDPLTAWGEIITSALNPLNLIQGILDPTQPLNANLLFGLLPLDVFGGVLPLPYITDQSEELVVDPNFTFDETVVGEGTWTVDRVNTYNGGNSVKVTADGSVKELFSNKVRVSEGQTVSGKAAAKWAALTGSGSPIELRLNTFLDDATVGSILIEAVPYSANGGFTDLAAANYVIPAGVNKVSLRLVVLDTATAGTVYFAKPSLKIVTDSNRWASMLGLSGIWDTLSDIFTFGDFTPGSTLDDVWAYGQAFAQIPQNIINSIWQGLFGSAPGGNVFLEDIIDGLQNINPLNVLGLTGGTIVDTFIHTIDTLWGGFAGIFGVSGKSISDVASLANNTVALADTAMQVSEWNNALLGVRNNKSLMEGMDETEESNFLITDLFTGAADPPIISATAGSVPMAFWRAKELAKKGVISWFGKGFTNVTNLYIDVYKFNFTTNTLELLHSSDDQIGQVTANWTLCQYFMEVIDRFDVTNGDVIGVAWRVVGTGTHSIAGKQAGSWMPNHPTVVPAKPAATRVGVGNLAFGSITYSGDMPWFGIGIATGDTPPDYHAPRTTQITDLGAYTYDVPDWADEVDEILVGAGGGGHGGDFIAFQTGQGGFPGAWLTRTLVRGVDFPDTTGVQLTGTIGAGGFQGSVAGAGGTGAPTTRNAIAGGAAADSAAGGVGGGSYASPHNGQSPGDETFNGNTYPGGGIASPGSGSVGRPGQPPGGGGGGGSGGTWGIAWNGGAGGRGGAWFVAKQAT